MFDPLVFSAGTFPIARRPENAFAEKAALLRLERQVMIRFGIFNYTLAPLAHGIARGHANRDLIETNCSFFAN